MTRRDDARVMRAAGATYQQIGDHLGVTRARAHQLVHGNPAPPRKQRVRADSAMAIAMFRGGVKRKEIAAVLAVSYSWVAAVTRGLRP